MGNLSAPVPVQIQPFQRPPEAAALCPIKQWLSETFQAALVGARTCMVCLHYVANRYAVPCRAPLATALIWAFWPVSRLARAGAGGRDRADVVAVPEHFVSDGHTTHVSASSLHGRASCLVGYVNALRARVSETVV